MFSNQCWIRIQRNLCTGNGCKRNQTLYNHRSWYQVYLLILGIFIFIGNPALASGGNDSGNEDGTPKDNYFCVLELLKVSTKEYVQTAYGMGNIGSMNLNELCEDFFSRDIATQSDDLRLINSWGDTTENPDQFWLDHNYRRPLTPEEIQVYSCFLEETGFLSVLGNGTIDLMPETPDSLRIPALLIDSIESFNSPILRFTAVQLWSTALPIIGIQGVVKLWKLVKK